MKLQMNRKTRICKNYPNCSYGENCFFIHEQKERQPRLLWHDVPKLSGIAICKKYLQDCCKYGSSCFFLHEKPKKNLAPIGSKKIFIE